MKTHINWMITLLVTIGMLLAACGGGVTETAAPPEPEVAVEEPVAEPEEVVEEPVEEVVVEEVIGEPDLDTAYNVFLTDMVKYNTLSLEGLNEMLTEDPDLYLLDVRQPQELEENGYIEGAVNIPLREIGSNIDLLPSFDTPIVSYCGSGWRCTIAMTALEGMGWETVYSLKGGSFGGWVEAGYPTASGLPEAVTLAAAEPDPALLDVMDEMFVSIPDGYGVVTVDNLAAELVENPDLILIDVRRQEELDENGVIDAANVIPLPLEEFVNQQDLWPTDLDAPVAVYCGSGHRSTIAMTILWSYGYTDVRSLKGGFNGWKEAGYAVLGGTQEAAIDLDTAYNIFLADMEKYNTLTIAGLNEMLIDDPDLYLLDVRQPGELEENGYIEGAVNIPLREIGQSIELLPSFDTPIVSYCGSGWRCTIAMTALEGMGWETVYSLKGGSFGGWVEAGYPTVAGLPEAVTLAAAEPDPALLGVMDEMFVFIPDGYGVVTADNLAAELVENPDLVLIDVRRQEELAENGVIDAPNVIPIPLETFVDQQADWPADLDAPIVIYCGSGHRSTIAMTILWSYGYTDVRSLKGGFNGWNEAGFPVVAG